MSPIPENQPRAYWRLGTPRNWRDVQERFYLRCVRARIEVWERKVAAVATAKTSTAMTATCFMGSSVFSLRRNLHGRVLDFDVRATAAGVPPEDEIRIAAQRPNRREQVRVGRRARTGQTCSVLGVTASRSAAE